MLLAFEMTLDVAEEFYKRCIARNAKTQKEKTDILVELAEEGKIRGITKTNRTSEQYIADMKKNFGKVLTVTKGKKDGAAQKKTNRRKR